MKDRLTTLREIRAVAPAYLALAADRWLNEEGIEEVSDRPGEIDVSRAASLWRLRARHVSEAGKHLLGAEEFLSELSTLNPTKKLRQYSFHGAEHEGIVFYEKASQRYVGLVIVETRKERDAAKSDLFAMAQSL